MKKLTLKTDALRVESFLPASASREADRGTVRANAETEGETCSMMGSCPTYEGTCGETCSPAGSCASEGQTCGKTCSMMGSCSTEV